MENRNDLVVYTTKPRGSAEREAAFSMIEDIPGRHRITLGADKGYVTKDFIDKLRDIYTTSHVVQK